jgi:hypothetical protein
MSISVKLCRWISWTLLAVAATMMLGGWLLAASEGRGLQQVSSALMLSALPVLILSTFLYLIQWAVGTILGIYSEKHQNRSN